MLNTQAPIPFSTERLDAYLDAAGIDVLVVNSKHNIQYLLGGHRHPFFDINDAIGVSRYLPLLIYHKGKPDRTLYIASRNEKDALSNRRDKAGLWVPQVEVKSSGTLDAMALAVAHLRSVGADGSRIGIEAGFLPLDAGTALRNGLPAATLVEALRPLERLRAVKSRDEHDLLRTASDLVVESMLSVIAQHGPGTVKRDLFEALRREETCRGLLFEYALITFGNSFNRAASEQVLQKNDIVSLDSGGNYHGYIGDLCRMAIVGEPDPQLQDLLAEVDAIQLAARGVIRAGISGGAIFEAAEPVLRASPSVGHLHFVAHGMGLIGHEAPRLTAAGPIPYPADDASLPLEAGMILSVETTLLHPVRGFIKLEDTVAVTPDSCEGFGDRARGWNTMGARDV